MNFLPVKVTQPAEEQTSHSNCLHKVVDGSQIQFHQSQVSFHTVPWPMAVFVLTSQDIGTYSSWGALSAHPSANWHQHRMMRPLLISLLVSKRWVPIKDGCTRLCYTQIPVLHSWALRHCRKKEELSLCLLPHLSLVLPWGLQTAPAPKGGALGKWLLQSWFWLGSCEWALPWWICPVLVHPPKSTTAMSTVSKCHWTFIFVKNHGHFHPLQLQAFPLLLCRWSKYSFVCV